MEAINTMKRRPRGASPRGDFETAKEAATSVLEAERAANREKTERLKARRAAISRQGLDAKPS